MKRARFAPWFLLLVLAGVALFLHFPAKPGNDPVLDDPEKLTVFGLFPTGGSRSFGVPEIAQMKTVSFLASDPFSVKKGGEARRFEMVPLRDLIAACRPTTDPETLWLVGADGYRAAVSPTDLAAGKIGIAFREDGLPIGGGKGPLRIVVDVADLSPGARKRLDSAWVWNLQRIYLGLQPPANRVAIELWTPIPPVITGQIEAEFESRHPEIDLVVRNMGATSLQDWVEESVAGNSSATPDLVWFSEPSGAENLKMAGRLEQYFPKHAEKIPTSLKDPDGCYTGVRVLKLGLACNTTFPLPGGMLDLLKTDYRGRIGWVRPGHVGAYLLAVLTGNDDLGWAFVRRVLEATPKENVFPTFGASCDAVAAGKLAIGISLDYLVANWIRANPDLPLTFVQPPQLAVSLASPIVILRDRARFRECAEFVDELLGDDIQLILRKNGFTPTRADLVASGTAGSPGTANEQAGPVDHRYLAVNAPVLRRLYDELESQVYGAAE